MAKLADAVDRALALREETGGPGDPQGRMLGAGDGWSVADVVCASGPRDRPFGERHDAVSIAIVGAGLFEYRSELGSELMTPGSMMLGSPGGAYECRHRHGAGDRCVSFSYDPAWFERLAADVGARGGAALGVARLPPLRVTTPLVARALAGVTGTASPMAWDELAVQLAARVLEAVDGHGARRAPPSSRAVARVAEVVRLVDREPDSDLTLDRLARDADLSPYHFLRTFTAVVGVTPHQYVLRARLREAARRLVTEPGRILDVALDCGFGDLSNFNHAFRAELGASPRQYRLGSSPPGEPSPGRSART